MKRNIKKMSKLPESLQSFVVKELEAQLSKYFANPDPQLLKSLSLILEHPIEELTANSKDNEDYNKHLVSRIVDRAVMVLMEAGQKEVKNGDIVRITKDQSYLSNPKRYENDVVSAREELGEMSDRYIDFSFDMTIWNEIRGKFLLQTEKTDSYKSMLSILDVEMLKFIDNNSWQKIKNAIKKAESRIFKTEINFPDPLDGMDEGGLKTLTDVDLEKMSISKNKVFKLGEDGTPVEKDFTEISVDSRFDNHDLLSMKELVLILQKKKTVSYFSIGLGFFAKYMPELRNEGIDGIIFKIKNNELVDIKLWTSIGTLNKNEYEIRTPQYSPVTASCAFLQEYAVDFNRVEFEDFAICNFNSVKNPIIEEDVRYYVLVDGCVSAPEWGKAEAPFSYENYSLNNVQVPAGEVFLFENRSGELMTTRLYFTPYEPKKLHPLHQLGSVVFGSNDQTYHSTTNKDVQKVSDMDLAAVLNRIQETAGKENDEQYTPSMSAFKFFFCKDEKMGTSLLKILKKDNAKNIAGLIYSLYEITPFSIEKELQSIHFVADLYTFDGFKEAILKVLNNYAPFSKRFLYKEYKQNDRATLEVQEAFLDELALKMKMSDNLATLRTDIVNKEIEDLSKDSSISYEEFEAKVDEIIKKSKKI